MIFKNQKNFNKKSGKVRKFFSASSVANLLVYKIVHLNTMPRTNALTSYEMLITAKFRNLPILIRHLFKTKSSQSF